MNTTVFTSARFVLAASAVLVAAAAGVGCTQNADGGALSRKLPGHGVASRSFDLDSGDHTNPFDTTDDPTDPSFVPVASPLKAWTPKSNVASTRDALSTTRGTSFQLTYYDISVRPQGDPDETDLYDCDGNWLTSASWNWADDAWTQGTARFTDSSGKKVTINDGQGCWVVLPTSQRWGLGVENPATGNIFALKPFRSIAVDPGTLTIGKWYYVKELDGARMPSPSTGMVHDGCVRAMDVGPAINGRHIDFFVAYFSAYQTLIDGDTTMGGLESITLYDGAAKCAQHVKQGY